MNFLLFAVSVVLLFLVHYIVKQIRKIDNNVLQEKKKFLTLIRFVKFAPILAFLILFVLVETILHTKQDIRLYHAWYVAQVWAYYTFLFSAYMITKNKICFFSMVVTLGMAVYTTPFFRFETIFTGHFLLMGMMLATILFINLWIVSLQVVRKK